MKTAIFCLTLTLSTLVIPQVIRGAAMPQATQHAAGPFEVKLDPQPADEKSGSPELTRLLLDKHFHGDLEATSKGTMLAAGPNSFRSGGYVAMEIVTGTLKGRAGTFVLQHTGTITRGTPTLNITVVPDSATGQLIGLTGKMIINLDNDKHSYTFDYTLPDAQ